MEDRYAFLILQKDVLITVEGYFKPEEWTVDEIEYLSHLVYQLSTGCHHQIVGIDLGIALVEVSGSHTGGVVDDSPQRRSAFATGVGRMEKIDIANTKFAGFYSHIRFVRFLWRQR